MIGLRNYILRVKPSSRTFLWQQAPFTSDASLAPFIRSGAVYSHALNFGYTVDTFVNGVTFKGIGTNYSAADLVCTAPLVIPPTSLNEATSLGPNSDILCGAFLYGAPYSLTLNNLIPNKFYRISFFHYPWDPAPAGFLQDIQESKSLRQLQFDRAVYIIYYSVFYNTDPTITFNFFANSHLYAMTSEQL
jgi:hypothetical protein